MAGTDGDEKDVEFLLGPEEGLCERAFASVEVRISRRLLEVRPIDQSVTQAERAEHTDRAGITLRVLRASSVFSAPPWCQRSPDQAR